MPTGLIIAINASALIAHAAAASTAVHVRPTQLAASHSFGSIRVAHSGVTQSIRPMTFANPHGFALIHVEQSDSADTLELEGDFSAGLALEGDFSDALELEGTP